MSNYYGSPLNEFIDKNCTHDFTCINIDCLLYKRETKELRIIESKHTLERMPKTQREALEVFGDILLGKRRDVTVGVYVVRGNLPYETAEISSLLNSGQFNLKQPDFINWLCFRLALQDKKPFKVADFLGGF